jgi:hypothetical protein
LSSRGISLDVFHIVGDPVIALIGYGMFQAPPPAQPEKSDSSSPQGLIATAQVSPSASAVGQIVIFAASTCFVATVVTPFSSTRGAAMNGHVTFS